MLPEEQGCSKSFQVKFTILHLLKNPFFTPSSFYPPLCKTRANRKHGCHLWPPLCFDDRLLRTTGWSPLCAIGLLRNSKVTSGIQLACVYKQWITRKLPPNLHSCGCVPDAGHRKLILPWNFWEKDGIQKMSWHIFFSIWACCQECSLPLLTLFCYQIGNKINKKTCDLPSESYTQ